MLLDKLLPAMNDAEYNFRFMIEVQLHVTRQ
jgi:hypothetical protein